MIGRLLALALAIGACGRDVRLGVAIDAAGDAGVDAPLDGSGNPFAPGAYTLTLGARASMCMGTLTGMEAGFASVTAASLGLTSGPVTLSTPDATTLVVTGAPITAAMNQLSIDLAFNAGNPPGLWNGLVSGDFTAGPLSTMRTATDLAVDTATATSPTGIVGEFAVLYTDISGGACSINFDVAITQP